MGRKCVGWLETHLIVNSALCNELLNGGTSLLELGGFVGFLQCCLMLLIGFDERVFDPGAGKQNAHGNNVVERLFVNEG